MSETPPPPVGRETGSGPRRGPEPEPGTPRLRAARRSADAAVREAVADLTARGVPATKWAVIRRVRLRTGLSPHDAVSAVEGYGRRHGVPELARRDPLGHFAESVTMTLRLARLVARGTVPVEDALRTVPRSVVFAAAVLFGMGLGVLWALSRR